MFDASELTTLELIRLVHHLQQQVEALTGETVRVRLPAPGAVVSVPFEHIHPSWNYAVQIELEPGSAGSVDDVEILEKQRNGLRLAYHGHADSVGIILWIQDRPEPHALY